MSTTFIDMGGAAGARLSLSRWMKHVRLPVGAWSGRRRRVIALLIAALVFGLGAHGWVVADLSGLGASRTAFDAATRHLADARRALTQLPALRREAASTPAAHLPLPWTSADDVRVVSELAAQNDVTLLSVEPGAASGSGAENMRPVRVTAQTDFVHLMSFLRELSDLPVLIVPEDVTVKRHGVLLAVSATLRVFSALRPAASSVAADAFADDSLDSDADADEDIVFYDPFSLPQMLAGADLPDASQLRLAGLLHDRTHALALLETPDGAATVASGQQFGTERVTRVDALGITLANGGATRTLALAEAS
jgi:Tfp pilus assembly protein PilO